MQQRLAVAALLPNPLQPMLTDDEALASMLEIASAEAWVQKVGRRHDATPKDMDIITQIIELGAAAWQFDVPLEVFQAKAPDNALKNLTPGQYWLWIHLEAGDDGLWKQLGAVASEFGSALQEEAVQDHALQLLEAVAAKQTSELLHEWAARAPVEPAGDGQLP